jgi:hypothetical protein
LQKGIRYLSDLKQKRGQVTLSNNVISVFACALHDSLPLSENRIKILKIQKENVFIWIRAPESANLMQSRASSNTAGTT